MDYEFACGSLQTVRAARMFYEYGKLDRLLKQNITNSEYTKEVQKLENLLGKERALAKRYVPELEAA